MSNIRSKESRINSSGGFAGGLLKYLKIVNESLRFFNQQGRRPGSAAIYLEPWHKDIMDLLEIKKNTGAEELRARDLFTALWMPDNFMRAVKEGGEDGSSYDEIGMEPTEPDTSDLDMGDEITAEPEVGEGNSYNSKINAIMDGMFTESKVDKILSKYFVETPEEKELNESKKVQTYINCTSHCRMILADILQCAWCIIRNFKEYLTDIITII